MTAIVTGFPSQIAALQFEWAWQNNHVTLHIPPDSRITHATQKKASGQPKRPPYTLTSLLSNLHLLLRVPSFARWPLELHFFSQDVYQSWVRHSSQSIAQLPSSVPIVLDFPSATIDSLDGTDVEHSALSEPCGIPEELNPGLSQSNREGNKTSRSLTDRIAALDVGYSRQKEHVEKSKSIVDFEVEGFCAVCREELEHDAGIYTVCPHHGCKSVSHLSCLSQHFLEAEREEQRNGPDSTDLLVPVEGSCPSCGGRSRWIDIVKETSLRYRGGKEVDKLLKKPRIKAEKEKKPAGRKRIRTRVVSDIEPDEADDNMENILEEEVEQRDDMNVGEVEPKFSGGQKDNGTWYTIDDFDDDDNRALMTSSAPMVGLESPEGYSRGRGKSQEIVIEDSDWDDAEILD